MNNFAIALIAGLVLSAAACGSNGSSPSPGTSGASGAQALASAGAAGSRPGAGGSAAGGASSGAAGNAAAAGTGGDSAVGGNAGQGQASGGAGGASGSSGAGGVGGVGGTAGVAGASGGATELIHYYGRWNRLTDRAITVNTGSHVAATFAGTALSVRFDVSLNESPNPTLAWQIDSGDWQEGELAATLPLASGLSAGPHHVTLMVRGFNEFQSRWGPPLTSSITFLGLDVTAGALQPTARPVQPQLEFLGDSITEGLYIWSTHNGQTTVPWRADAPRSWASLTAKTLGAEWRQVGFGGQGLLKGGSGNVPPANDTFNWIYQGVAREAWQPDLVRINQGTNDGGASAADFRAAYAAYIGTVRSAYASAKIAAMRPYGGAHATEIQAEVNARRAAGDQRLFFIDTSGWLGNGDFTDGTHPNDQGSKKAASALTAAIHSLGLL